MPDLVLVCVNEFTISVEGEKVEKKIDIYR